MTQFGHVTWILLVYPSHCVVSIRVSRISRSCDLERWKCSMSRNESMACPTSKLMALIHTSQRNGKIIGLMRFLSAMRRPLDSRRPHELRRKSGVIRNRHGTQRNATQCNVLRNATWPYTWYTRYIPTLRKTATGVRDRTICGVARYNGAVSTYDGDGLVSSRLV